MNFWHRLPSSIVMLFCLMALGCPKPTPASQPVPKPPPLSPAEQETKTLQTMHDDALLAKEDKDPETAANALIFLLLEAQAQYLLYKEENPKEFEKGRLSKESIEYRMTIGRFFREFLKRDLHLLPRKFQIELRGETPLGAMVLKIVKSDLFREESSENKAVLQGQFDLLKLTYDGVLALNVTHIEPKVDAGKRLSQYGILVCDAIIEIYESNKFQRLTSLREEKAQIERLKQSAKEQKKLFRDYAKSR